MKEVVKKEILYDLRETIKILERKDDKDIRQLRILSNHAIEDVALHKDLDMISITVMVYSLFKTIHCIKKEDYQRLINNLKMAEKSLNNNNFGSYNKNIRAIFRIIHSCSKEVRKHLQDVTQAARMKKGAVLLEKGLSIGQAAGLMGLSNWDLQGYASKTTALEISHEKVSAAKRLKKAFTIFNVS